MTPSQCRGARGLLGWTGDHLSNKAGIYGKAAARFENEYDHALSEDSKLRLEAALCAEGIRFPPGGVQRNPGPVPLHSLCRGARLYLHLTVSGLGAAAGFSGTMVACFERGTGRGRALTHQMIVAALRARGIRFTENGFFLESDT